MDFKKYDWDVINAEDGGNLLKFTVFVDFVEHLPKEFFGSDFLIALELRRGRLRYAPEKRYEVFVSQLFERLVNDDSFFHECALKIKHYSQLFLEFSQSIQKENCPALSKEAIISILEKWFLLYQGLTDYGMCLVYVDMGTALLTKEALLRIDEASKGKSNVVSSAEIFSILSAPLSPSSIFDEETHLLRLAKYTEEKKFDPKTSNDQELTKYINEHLKNFEWVYYAYQGPVMKEEDVRRRIALEQERGNIQKRLEEHELYFTQLQNKQKYWNENLELSPRTQTLIEISRASILAKSERKNAMTQSFYLIDLLLKEIAKRTNISWEELHHLFPWEFEKLLEGKIQREVLRARYEHCVYFTGGTLIIGDEAENFSPHLEPQIKNIHELKGQCACPGTVEGKVKIVNIIDDMAKMEEGDILVSVATIPEIVPAMKNAAAIVTDMGGITSHAAIISREFKIPCVIGTKIATKVLKDGDRVFVDATSGKVRRASY